MKPGIVLLTAVAVGTLLHPLSAAEPREEKKSMRVLAAPDREPRPFERREKLEMESVSFLGVETGPVSVTVSAQLGLTRGTGLVVNHVLPKSPADGVLKEHDILLKLEDQILIETRQLSVLIRSRSEGEEVTLTYLRAGQKATAKVKLATHEVPKMALESEVNRRFEFEPGLIGPEAGRAEADRILGLIQRSRSGEPTRIQIERSGGPGVRAMAINTDNSSLTFSDGEGTLEISSKEGARTLVATDAKGQQVFSGPITTPEERKALPDGVRERLEKVEGMRDVTFRTDSEFRGTGLRVVRPRGIFTPAPPPRAPIPSL